MANKLLSNTEIGNALQNLLSRSFEISLVPDQRFMDEIPQKVVFPYSSHCFPFPAIMLTYSEKEFEEAMKTRVEDLCFDLSYKDIPDGKPMFMELVLPYGAEDPGTMRGVTPSGLAYSIIRYYDIRRDCMVGCLAIGYSVGVLIESNPK